MECGDKSRRTVLSDFGIGIDGRERKGKVVDWIRKHENGSKYSDNWAVGVSFCSCGGIVGEELICQKCGRKSRV